MGQLEKYGLYVLCLVIFLILGVALWGEPANAADSGRTKELVQAPARAAAPVHDLSDFQDLMSNAAKPATTPAAPPRSDAKVDDPAPSDDHGAPAGKEPAKTPAAEERRSHTIVAGDTLEGIARQELGDPRLVALIRELNPKVAPERLQLGKPLVLPTATEVAAARSKSQPVDHAAPTDPVADKKTTEKKATDKAVADKKPEAAPTKSAARTHRIERGDTLEGIAVTYFGSKKRVEDIKKLNPTLDPTRLRIGQLVRLPD